MEILEDLLVLGLVEDLVAQVRIGSKPAALHVETRVERSTSRDGTQRVGLAVAGMLDSRLTRVRRKATQVLPKFDLPDTRRRLERVRDRDLDSRTRSAAETALTQL